MARASSYIADQPSLITVIANKKKAFIFKNIKVFSQEIRCWSVSLVTANILTQTTYGNLEQNRRGHMMSMRSIPDKYWPC